MLEVLFASLVPVVSFLHWGDDFHRSRTFAGLILASLAVGAIVWKRVHWSAGLAMAWTLLSGCLVFGAQESPFTALVGLDQPIPPSLTPEMKLAVSEAIRALAFLDTAAAVAALSMIAYTLPVVFADKRIRAALLMGFGWLCFLDSVYVLTQLVAGNGYFESGGVFGNYSMNACVIAFTYPVWTRGYRRPGGALEAIGGLVALIMPVLAVLLSRSNMALLALIAAFIAPFIPHMGKLRPRQVIRCAVTVALLGVTSWLIMGGKLGQASGRYAVWVGLVNWWWVHANPWLGTGLGTLFFLGPHIQVADLHQTTGGFFWAHNDPLTIGFEMGALGIAFIALMLGCAAHRAVKSGRAYLLSSMAAYLVASLGTYPTHLPIPGVFGALLIVTAFCDGPSGVIHSCDEVTKCRT